MSGERKGPRPRSLYAVAPHQDGSEAARFLREQPPAPEPPPRTAEAPRVGLIALALLGHRVITRGEI